MSVKDFCTPFENNIEILEDVFQDFFLQMQARSQNEANEAVASPKISKKNLPQMKNS